MVPYMKQEPYTDVQKKFTVQPQTAPACYCFVKVPGVAAAAAADAATGGTSRDGDNGSNLAGENRSIHAILIRSTTLPTEVMAGRASMYTGCAKTFSFSVAFFFERAPE